MTEPLIRTLADLPFHASGRFPKPVLLRRCVGDRFEDRSSREVFDEVRDLSLGLEGIGVRAGDRVAILADSRPEWTITDLATLTAGAVTVPVYATLPAGQVGYILADAGARVVVVEDDLQAAKVHAERHRLPDLETVIVMDPRAEGVQSGERSLAEVVDRGHRRLMKENGLGRLYKERSQSIDADALATIIYTSGTTGHPKGVMLSHHNLVANMVDVDQVIDITDDDTALSFLPLSHAFERLVVYLYLYKGATIAFGEAIETLGRDMQQVRPTIMTGVPRVYEKLRARIIGAVAEAPRVRQGLFAWAVGVGHAAARARLAGREPGLLTRAQEGVADRLVLSKIRARMGGRLRFVVSGSAPLSREVAEFLYAVGLPVVEGYGLTETSPVLTTTPLGAGRIGTVGTALPQVELRIAADGEILARGPNVMIGYYNNPEATAAVIRDGWFYTGDIGRIDADGYLSITDRKKELIVTAGGKNVAPQPIEGLLKRDPLVAEAVLVGDRRRFVSVLLVPDFPILEQRLAVDGLAPGPPAELVGREDVQRIFQPIVDQANSDLASYEQVKRFALLPAEFSVATGELTPTLKVKRRVVEDRWQDVIEGIYAASQNPKPEA
ncbi:MAG: long-chain fatty acid--CoA ligase [Acidobacteria bacterium]|nr:MAG: long-chain fatty acid--CoA ligase [Acidobacteriota bacterium]